MLNAQKNDCLFFRSITGRKCKHIPPKPKIWKHYQTLRLEPSSSFFSCSHDGWVHRLVIELWFVIFQNCSKPNTSIFHTRPKKNLTAAALVVEAQEFLLEFSKGESWSSFFGHDHIRCWMASRSSITSEENRAKQKLILAWKGFIHELDGVKLTERYIGWANFEEKTHFDTTCLFEVFINNNIYKPHTRHSYTFPKRKKKEEKKFHT